ncbi:hypothetical protein 2 [Hubei rhabdo-like virus 2]|uniref:hypothetical protein 2 n=1 Tax=Hubei rhabdo-like virus 2 TaxID=1923186 RepID=UPI00090A08A5|nr:hypothetical protein 2 [Hubei rhabdo-like virus 2]APG78808.1 hypothetical protein 2 [Hubei rhabdo-like virus 2]
MADRSEDNEPQWARMSDEMQLTASRTYELSMAQEGIPVGDDFSDAPSHQSESMHTAESTGFSTAEPILAAGLQRTEGGEFTPSEHTEETTDPGIQETDTSTITASAVRRSLSTPQVLHKSSRSRGASDSSEEDSEIGEEKFCDSFLDTMRYTGVHLLGYQKNQAESTAKQIYRYCPKKVQSILNWGLDLIVRTLPFKITVETDKQADSLRRSIGETQVVLKEHQILAEKYAESQQNLLDQMKAIQLDLVHQIGQASMAAKVQPVDNGDQLRTLIAIIGQVKIMDPTTQVERYPTMEELQHLETYKTADNLLRAYGKAGVMIQDWITQFK